MGTYYIPRNLSGETRILYIFSVKSLITTVGGLMLGGVIYFMMSLIGQKIVGLVALALCALIGFGIGAIKIPTLSGIPFTKNIGGDSLSEIILRYIKFKKNRKLYIYTKED